MPAYCAVALAGLNDLPDTLMSRSVVVRMRKRAPSEQVDQWRHREGTVQAEPLAQRLGQWAAAFPDTFPWPEMPTEVNDRDADIWEALLVVGDRAGGDWPNRARVAAVALVAHSKRDTSSLGVLLLGHLRDVFGDQEAMHTEDIIEKLLGIDEGPWADLRGKPIDGRRLARYLKDYDVRPVDVKIAGVNKKGYRREDLWDPWSRYLSSPDDPQVRPQPDTSATCATRATNRSESDLLPSPGTSATCATEADANGAGLATARPELRDHDGSRTGAVENATVDSSSMKFLMHELGARPVPAEAAPWAGIGPCVNCGARTRRYGEQGSPLCDACHAAKQESRRSISAS